ncbi:MAG: serine hydrolase, partial [Actinomycetota bacterium]|nr:serine hydrolase [Actinomycetota bacterium]
THVRGDDGTWDARSVRQPDAQTPAGGVSSTVADLSQWMRLQLANGTVDGVELIDGAALDLTHTPHGLSGGLGSPESRVGSYGLGFNLGTDGGGRQRWSHSGAFALGAGTSLTMMPAERLGVVVLTNGEPTGVAESMVETFLDLVFEGEPTRDWMGLYGPMFQQMLHPEVEVDHSVAPEGAAPARELSEYVGTYDNDLYGPFEITVAGGELSLGIGPNGDQLTLSHHDGDTFAMNPVGENATGSTAVIFDLDVAAPTVRVEYLDEQGLGTFVRA